MLTIADLKKVHKKYNLISMTRGINTVLCVHMKAPRPKIIFLLFHIFSPNELLCKLNNAAAILNVTTVATGGF